MIYGSKDDGTVIDFVTAQWERQVKTARSEALVDLRYSLRIASEHEDTEWLLDYCRIVLEEETASG